MVSLRGTTTAIAGLLALAVVLPAAADEDVVPFTRVVIDANPPPKPYYKMAGDLTGDGRPEIVVGGAAGPLVMYIAPDWQKRVIATAGYKGGVNGEVADLNGDGHLDVVMGSVVWFENPADDDADWTVHTIDREPIHDVEVADLDGDGRPDVVARDQSAFGNNGDRIFVYRQRRDDKWDKQVIACPHGEGLELADLDDDADPDLVIGGIWFENRGGQWSEHAYAPDWMELDTKVEAGDVNGDGRLDVVVTPSELKGEQFRISWFESPAGDITQSWQEHVVVPQIECVVHSLALGDFDRDGRLDIAAAEMHQGQDPDDVFVLFNPGGSDNSWRKQILDRGGSHDIVAADLDADGDLELFGANHSGTHPLVLWENRQAR